MTMDVYITIAPDSSPRLKAGASSGAMVRDQDCNTSGFQVNNVLVVR